MGFEGLEGVVVGRFLFFRPAPSCRPIGQCQDVHSMPESIKNRCNAFRLTMIFDGIFDGTKSAYRETVIYKSMA